jgi:hypothetical protein
MSTLSRLPRADGPITTAIRDAMKLRLKLLADGTPEHEADRICGQGLKAVLGNSRAEPWRFLCERCKDSGWIDVDPSRAELVRLIELYGPDPKYQGYVMACEPCRWRTREREKRRERFDEDDESFAAAGRTQRRKR